MDDYLTKPLDRGRLAATLSRHLSSSAGPATKEPPPARSDGADTTAPVDWPQFMQVADHDEGLVQELVELFIQSGDTALRDIRNAVDAGDLRAVGRAAHSLKGASANIHARATSVAAGHLETAATSGTTTDLVALEARLRLEAARAMDFLKAKRA